MQYQHLQASRPARLFALLAAIVAVAGVVPAQAGEYSRIVAFGDSLMDSGNAFELTGEVATPPFAPIPSAPYAVGGLHFSNGKTWVEQLGETLGLAGSTGPSVRNPAVFSNYAIGGSRARQVATSPHAAQQVAAFLAGGNVPADALYLVGFGGNDVRDVLVSGNPAIIGDAVNAIAGNLLSLCSSGALDIVVVNVPNVGATPALAAAGPAAQGFATFAAAQMNQGVQAAIAGFVAPMCPGTQFRVLDLFSLSTAVAMFPQNFGFASPAPCLTFGVTGSAICSQPDTRFFWDAIHPTRAGHAVIAAEAAGVVAH